MGSDGHVLTVGGASDLADRAVARLADLHARWTRFDDRSELSLLNAAGGRPCIVSPDTAALVATMRRGWEATDGRFDPTVGPALEALGYATSWPDVAVPSRLADPAPAPGCHGIVVDERVGLVQLPADVRLDPGGIGKGLAADLVAAELMAAGSDGV